MKKFALLTSILALAACGGGSHHAGERVRISEQPTYQPSYLLTTEQTRSSNAEITSMVSEIAVCQNCSSPRTNESRISTDVQYGKGTFTVYDLSDVKFTLADEGALEPDSEDFYFVVDEDKKIIGINLAEQGHSWREKASHPEHDQQKEVDADLVLQKDNDNKNVFHGYVNHDNWVETNAVPVFMSKNKNMDLKYSDFGYLDLTAAKENWTPVFIGGYDVKKVDPTKIDEDFKFSGYAVGYVAVFKDGSDDAQTKSLKSDATLTFANGHSDLVADFTDWYKVNYTESYDEKGKVSSRNIDFTDYKGENDTFKMLRENPSFSSADTYQEYEDRDDPANTYNTVESDIRYFGNVKTPIEAVGIIQVRDCEGGKCGDFDVENVRNDEVRMNLSFGVK